MTFAKSSSKYKRFKHKHEYQNEDSIVVGLFCCAELQHSLDVYTSATPVQLLLNQQIGQLYGTNSMHIGMKTLWRWLAEVQTEHQNTGRGDISDFDGCWYQMSWSSGIFPQNLHLGL